MKYITELETNKSPKTFIPIVPAKPILSLERYYVFEAFAVGGMASVHLARLKAARDFTKTVVIKRLHPYYAKDEEFRTLFLDEARVAARIQHSNVVSINDVVDQLGELFLVMEYVNGETLSHILKLLKKRNTKIPIEIVLGLMEQLLQGLAAAHNAVDKRGNPLEIVHRDISPENVMITFDGVAKILDFGIAKAANTVHVTEEGFVRGKIAYMSPEQLSGSTIDYRSDLYSVALVFWEMLTGERLFKSKSPELLKKSSVLTDLPSLINNNVTQELDELLIKALQPKPKDRFLNATTFYNELRLLNFNIANATEISEWITSEFKVQLEILEKRILEVEAFDPNNLTSEILHNESFNYNPNSTIDSLNRLSIDSNPLNSNPNIDARINKTGSNSTHSNSVQLEIPNAIVSNPFNTIHSIDKPVVVTSLLHIRLYIGLMLIIIGLLITIYIKLNQPKYSSIKNNNIIRINLTQFNSINFKSINLKTSNKSKDKTFNKPKEINNVTHDQSKLKNAEKYSTKVSCNPPYTVDPKTGHKRFKHECFK